ncbi:MAG: hypothetical protein EDX89_08420 [Acidobacteria bacterium]|nr:MAG: hypothetical protein EDX89_08420 [Acidobacteriota bacterium]
MEGFWVAVCLLGIYAAAQFAIRARPLAGTGPLDVDEGLTYPALSQAGSVFSLSALFGAYLGMYWLLGLPAIVGVAVGSLLALWFVRSVILRSGADRYDGFLCGTFLGGDASTKLVTNGLIVVTQLAYVASELLILRQLLLTGFHLAPKHATIVVTAVAVIGYYYVLRGGYVALFRADAVQALFVGLMVISLLVSARADSLSGVTTLFQLRHLGYWRFGGLPHTWAVLAHGLVGAVMGFSFLAASPDSWKRVFLVTRRASRRPFLVLLAASVAPFLVTLPLLLVMVPPKAGSIVLLDAFPGVRQHEGFLIMTLLGLIASTLSAFNGSVMAAAHLVVVSLRRSATDPRPTTLAHYHWTMAGALLVFSLVFFGLLRFGNAYALGIFLIGPFSAAAGLLLGTWGLRRQPPTAVLLVALVGCLGAWLSWLLREPHVLAASNTAQVETIPIGLLPFLITFALGLASGHRKERSHV